MIGDHQPRRYRDNLDRVQIAMAIIATIAILFLVVTYRVPADHTPDRCDLTEECQP